MTRLDRYILARFLSNFVVLFALLFIFAISIDVIIQLDRFSEAAAGAVHQHRFRSSIVAFVVAVIDFQGPKLFQFYGYLLGLVSVGAMAFTFSQMHRHRELVGVLASGISLHRVGVPLILGAFGLNIVQLVNQEIMLPRLAPMLIRDHDRILQPAVTRFSVPLTRDEAGNILYAASLDTLSGEIDGLLFIERDQRGITQRRITASHATYDESERLWRLADGRAMTPTPANSTRATKDFTTPVDSVATSLSPKALMVRRYAQYAQMLSLRQINEAVREGGINRDDLARYRYSRLAAVLVNLLVLLLSMPSYLLREPANLLRQSVECAIISIPAMLGAFVGMTVSLPGLSPALSVFLPVIVLIPLSLARTTAVRT